MGRGFFRVTRKSKKGGEDFSIKVKYIGNGRIKFYLKKEEGKVIWDKVFRNGPSKICERQTLKNLKGYGRLSRPYTFKFCKGCLPQILLGQFLNTLSHIVERVEADGLKGKSHFKFFRFVLRHGLIILLSFFYLCLATLR